MRIAVGMSGGVDSSVTAALLKEQGHEVTGITMKIWPGGGEHIHAVRHGCYGPGDEADIADAKKVAAGLGISHHVIDLTQEYKSEVLDYFCDQYLSGRTPNPCVRCNQRVKFGTLIRKASENFDLDYFATGHYARVQFDAATSRYVLKKGRDLKKDQSYFLTALAQEQLKKVMFPLGDLTKDEVRKLAVKFGLAVAEKPESQDFAEGGYFSLLAGEAKSGPIIDKEGTILGQHRGIQFYTIGQRHGIGIASPRPLYVTGIDAAANAVVVGDKEDTLETTFVVDDVNWISINRPEISVEACVKIRYRHAEAKATITPAKGTQATVKFFEPQSAITPGQAAVFYNEDVVLGGGTIDRVIKTKV